MTYFDILCHNFNSHHIVAVAVQIHNGDKVCQGEIMFVLVQLVQVETPDKFLAYTALVVEDIRPTFLIAYTADITFVMSKIKVTLSLYFLWISLLHEMECRIVTLPFWLFLLYVIYVICYPLLRLRSLSLPCFSWHLLLSSSQLLLARFLACCIKLSSAENLYG